MDAPSRAAASHPELRAGWPVSHRVLAPMKNEHSTERASHRTWRLLRSQRADAHRESERLLRGRHLGVGHLWREARGDLVNPRRGGARDKGLLGDGLGRRLGSVQRAHAVRRVGLVGVLASQPADEPRRRRIEHVRQQPIQLHREGLRAARHLVERDHRAQRREGARRLHTQAFLNLCTARDGAVASSEAPNERTAFPATSRASPAWQAEATAWQTWLGRWAKLSSWIASCPISRATCTSRASSASNLSTRSLNRGGGRGRSVEEAQPHVDILAVDLDQEVARAARLVRLHRLLAVRIFEDGPAGRVAERVRERLADGGAGLVVCDEDPVTEGPSPALQRRGQGALPHTLAATARDATPDSLDPSWGH
eukprot:6214062-Pleurochrysis_carterae.AAC.2